jgi:hypothetical protein
MTKKGKIGVGNQRRVSGVGTCFQQVLEPREQEKKRIDGNRPWDGLIVTVVP